MKLLPSLAALALLLLTQCKKDAPDPASQLPPATQTGANTFGCLVNGQVWVPKGTIGITSNYYINYDPTFNGGDLDIQTYRVNERKDYIILGSDNIKSAGTYVIANPSYTYLSYSTLSRASSAIPGPCDEYRSLDSNAYCKGQLTITRLDLQAGIIAGTFACTLWRPGCDTIRITQGRFDKKL